MLATQIAFYFDASIVELDPYGVLTKTLDDRVVKIELDEEIPVITSGDVIYDFGGFDDIRLNQLSSRADLVIIPFNPTINALGTTLKSYKRVKELNLPILFVVNSFIKDSDVDDAVNFLSENTQDEIDYFAIPHTRALQTSENEGVSIIDIANSGGLKKHTYRKISKTMKNLMKKIEEYI